MEKIDMEAIARWSGIWNGTVCTATIQESVAEVANCTPAYCPSCHFYKKRPPNFRDPEWLVRLLNELARRGYAWEYNDDYTTIKRRPAKLPYEIAFGEADNWIDAFLLAVTKLAKEV